MKIQSIILLALLLFACKRNQHPKTEQHFGPAYFKGYGNYFWFKPGSFWIYENKRTGELDTCTLMDIKRDTSTFFFETVSFKRRFTAETIDWTIKTSHNPKGFITYKSSRPCNCPGEDTTIGIMRNSHPDKVFSIPWNSHPSATYFPSYKIDTATYYQVYRFDMNNDPTLPLWDKSKIDFLTPVPGSYYWAEGIGLISIKYGNRHAVTNEADSAFWNLKEYKIIKY